MMKKRYKKTAGIYNKMANEYSKRVSNFSQKPKLARFLNKILIDSPLVLDVGTAGGRDAKELISLGAKVIGIDISEELLRIAEQEVPEADFQLMSMNDLKFEPNTFNGIWASASFHHLDYEDMPDTFTQFYDILKPEGVLFVSTKEGKSKIDAKHGYSNQTREFSLLSNEDANRLISEAGFRDIKIITEQDGVRSNVNWLNIFATKS